MQFYHLNWLAIVVAAISTVIVGFLWYSPLLFAKPWMREMGYDPNDKAKTQEMQKSAGRALRRFLCRQPDFRVHSRSYPPRAAHRGLAFWSDGQLPRLAWLRRHRAIYRRPFHEAKHETLRHQHRLPARLLPRHGNNPLRLAVAQRSSDWREFPLYFFLSRLPLYPRAEALRGTGRLGKPSSIKGLPGNVSGAPSARNPASLCPVTSAPDWGRPKLAVFSDSGLRSV